MHSIRRIAVASARTSLSASLSASRAPAARFAPLLARPSNVARQFSVLATRNLSRTGALLEGDSGEQLNNERYGDRGSESSRPNYTIAVSNVLKDTPIEELEEAFGRFGTVVNSKMIAQRMGNHLYFFRFKNAEEAAAAIEGANQTIYGGRCIFVEEARNQLPSNRLRDATDTLYIGGLPYDATDAELTAFFKAVDQEMVAVRIASNRATGKLAGYAHATFRTVEAASRARQQLIGSKIGNRSIWIDFAVNRRPVRTFRDKESEPKALSDAPNPFTEVSGEEADGYVARQAAESETGLKEGTSEEPAVEENTEAKDEKA